MLSDAFYGETKFMGKAERYLMPLILSVTCVIKRQAIEYRDKKMGGVWYHRLTLLRMDLTSS